MEKVNLFWAIIWAVVLACIIAGIFGKIVPLIIAGLLSAGMLTMFVVDYIQEKRMK